MNVAWIKEKKRRKGGKIEGLISTARKKNAKIGRERKQESKKGKITVLTEIVSRDDLETICQGAYHAEIVSEEM